MTSSYYPITTDNYYDNKQSKTINSYQIGKTKKKTYDDSDDDDDDLDALRKAALKTLYTNKRKDTYEHSPIDHNSRPSSRSYSSSRSSRSRSYSSSSSLSSISSNSLGRNDKDYRFETSEKSHNGDIDERFPQDISNDDDALIVHCPIHDDELLVHDEQKPPVNNWKEEKSKKSSHDDQRHSKTLPSKQPSKNEKKRSPSIERPVSITVKLNSEDFDLRQLIKKRRTNESLPNNQRIVQILSKDNDIQKSTYDRRDERRSDKNNRKH